ncbi:MAG: hypothetical protein AAGC81_19630, partial [Pseudomonadota bacterium]
RLEEALETVEGRDKLFDDEERWFDDPLLLAGKIENTIKDKAPDRLIKWSAALPEELARELIDYEARLLAAELLRMEKPPVKMPVEPWGLRKVLGLMVFGGGISFEMPFVRMALRDYRAIAFRRGSGRYHMVASSDWIDQQIPERGTDGWRFIITSDLPRGVRGTAGHGPRLPSEISWEDEVTATLIDLRMQIGGSNPYCTKPEFIETCRSRLGLTVRAAERVYASVKTNKWLGTGPKRKLRELLKESSTHIESVTRDLEQRRR